MLKFRKMIGVVNIIVKYPRNINLNTKIHANKKAGLSNDALCFCFRLCCYMFRDTIGALLFEIDLSDIAIGLCRHLPRYFISSLFPSASIWFYTMWTRFYVWCHIQKLRSTCFMSFSLENKTLNFILFFSSMKLCKWAYKQEPVRVCYTYICGKKSEHTTKNARRKRKTNRRYLWWFRIVKYRFTWNAWHIQWNAWHTVNGADLCRLRERLQSLFNIHSISRDLVCYVCIFCFEFSLIFFAMAAKKR